MAIYAAVSFDEETVRNIQRLQEIGRIRNPVPPEDLHCTWCFTMKDLPWITRSRAVEPAEVCYIDPKEPYMILQGRKDLLSQTFMPVKPKSCLVLKLQAEWLHKKWQTALDHGSTWNFPEYLPHITISYDYDPELETSIKSLYRPDFSVRITYEFSKVAKD